MAKRIPAAERLELADRLRSVVEKIGTQAAAAKIAGVSERQMRMYLAAASSLSLGAAKNLADAAEVDVHWLVTGGKKTADGRASTSHSDATAAAEQTSALDREVRASVAVLLEVYEAAGFPFAEDDGRYDLFGDAYYMAAACPEAMQLRAATLIVESHRRAIRYIFHRLGRPIPQLPLPRGPDEPK